MRRHLIKWISSSSTYNCVFCLWFDLRVFINRCMVFLHVFSSPKESYASAIQPGLGRYTLIASSSINRRLSREYSCYISPIRLDSCAPAVKPWAISIITGHRLTFYADSNIYRGHRVFHDTVLTFITSIRRLISVESRLGFFELSVIDLLNSLTAFSDGLPTTLFSRQLLTQPGTTTPTAIIWLPVGRWTLRPAGFPSHCRC